MAEDFQRIPPEELHFDPENPRLPHWVDAADDQAVLGWMLEDAGLLELMGSVAVNGFFPAEPLLVVPRPASAGGYVVLEGNRRLAAVRLILEPSRAPRRRQAVQNIAADAVRRESLSALPCAVFERREQVLDYLGFRHITGIKQWEPAAKARYLDELYREHLPTAGANVYRHIARIIGSRADYVSRLLGSLRLYERIVDDVSLRQQGLSDEDISFSLLTLALNYSAITQFLELESLHQEAFESPNMERVRKLATWLFIEQPLLGRTQLGESRNMRLLAAAVSTAEGIAALDRGETVEDAAAAAMDVSDLLERLLRQARDRLVQAQGLVHRAPVTVTTTPLLDEIEDLVGQLLLLVRRKERRSERADV